LITAGVIIGPSVGYFYSDCGGRGAKGLAIRGIVATATAATATAVAYSVQGDGWMDFSGLIAGLVIGGVGSVVVATDAVVDLCKVEKNVRARNEQRSRTTIGLVPGYSPDSGTPTLSLQVKF
ncbi:MAG: hypothetical protein NTW07_01760, partial [candidate division Zixibacteria bacterium]|nr:hypothetical protein [candidate division Zixibacteria bacterium]